MKRIISLLLAVVMMISMTTTSFAANPSEEYYTVQVEYSDNIGHQEELDIMIQNNNVFVDAKMLAERLGYTFGENGESAVILNKDTSNGLPFGITQFKYDSTQVSHMLFNNLVDTYEAPFASVKNSEGSWIPLEYSLLLINSGMMISDDALLIDIPTKRIIDYFYDIAKNSEKYNFDWADDFGYTDTDLKVLGGSSHLINVFNGLLGFDGASWATLFQQFAGSMASYDKKYGENLAMLLCTESDKELQATIDKVDMLIDVLDEDGKLGQMLSSTSAMLDSQVGTLYKNCEDILQKVKSGNSPLVSYNRSYQALEDALDRQTWFSNTGGNILEVQKGVSSAAGKAFTFLDVGTKVLEVVGYAQEFQNQDKFSLAALTYYLGNETGGLELSEAMKKSMIDYSDALSSSIGEYTTKRFAENVDQWIIDEIPMHEVLGTQAAAVLFAWNIASNTIPFIANGLSGADSFELALYSLVFQGDTYLNYLDKRDSVFADAGNITAENIYDIAQYCYIYLKSCYVTREAALASLVNKSNSTKEKIQPLIDYQNAINTEIAKIMVELKGANKTNDGCVFGFSPSDNEAYLGKYDDSQLISWIKEPSIDYDNLVIDAFSHTYSDEYGVYECHIPKIMLDSDTVDTINEEIWNWCYESAMKEQLDVMSLGASIYMYGISYEWALNGDILSLCILQRWDAGCDYYEVYNISISTGEIVPKNDILEYAGFSEEKYIDVAEQAMGSGYLSYYAFDANSDIGNFSDFHREFLEMTLSEENINQAVPFINDAGEVCIVSIQYSGAGADWYYRLYNLENFEMFPYYAEIINSPIPEIGPIALPDWKTSYINYIEEELLSGYCSYDSYVIVYLDEDDIPEIFLRSESAIPGEAILWISNGSVIEESEIGYSTSGDIHYYEKQGLICTSWLNHGNYSDTVYSLSAGEFKILHRGRVFTDWDNPTFVDNEIVSTYQWDDQDVTKEQYDNHLNASFDRSTASVAQFDKSINNLVESIKNW